MPNLDRRALAVLNLINSAGPLTAPMVAKGLGEGREAHQLMISLAGRGLLRRIHSLEGTADSWAMTAAGLRELAAAANHTPPRKAEPCVCTPRASRK